MARKGQDGDGVFQKPAGSRIYWARWRDENGDLHHKKIGKGEAGRKNAQEYVVTERDTARNRKLFPERYEVQETTQPWTVAEATANYQENSRASTRSKSFARDAGHAKYFTELWGPLVLQQIKPATVEDWMTQRSKQVTDRRRSKKKGKKPIMRRISAATVNRELGYLKRVARKAMARGRSRTDPTFGLKPLELPTRKPRYLLPEEDARLREQLTGRNWLIVELAYRTGMRENEQFTLVRDQVNLRQKQITVVGKKGEEEIVHLNSRAVEIVRELMDNPTQWVIPNHAGTNHLHGDTFIRRVFHPALTRAGIKRFRWHDLRHTHASWLAISGVDLLRIRDLMRHRSIRMTEVYAHLLQTHLEDAVELVAGAPPTGARSR